MNYSALTSPRYVWKHSDPRPGGIAAAADAGLARAESGDFGGAKSLVAADLRALVLRSAVAAMNLSGASLAPGEYGEIQIPDLALATWPSDAHQATGAALLRTWGVLGLGGAPSAYSIETVGGAPAAMGQSDPNAEGWQYLAGFIFLVGAAAYVVNSIYTAEYTSFVADRAMRRKDTGDKLLATHATLLKLVEQHSAAERAAGAALPFSVAEKTAWAALVAEQDHFVDAVTHEAPPPTPKGGGIFSGLGAGAVLAAAALGYVLLKKG